MKPLRNAIFILAFCSVLIGGITAYAANKQLADKQFIKEELSSLDSYTNETIYLLQLYHDNKLSSLYVKIHTQYLNKKTISLYDQLATMTIPTQQLQDINQTERIALKLSQQIATISNIDSDQKQMTNHIRSLQEIKKELQPLQKNYE